MTVDASERMIVALEEAGFVATYVRGVPYWSFPFRAGEADFELALEPLLFGGWALALYDGDQELVLQKKVEIP